jgi:hypothetical protein
LSKHWNAETQFTADEIIEEVSWLVIEDRGWVPTPLLLMWLEKLVDECIDAKKLVEITD